MILNFLTLVMVLFESVPGKVEGGAADGHVGARLHIRIHLAEVDAPLPGARCCMGSE